MDLLFPLLSNNAVNRTITCFQQLQRHSYYIPEDSAIIIITFASQLLVPFQNTTSSSKYSYTKYKLDNSNSNIQHPQLMECDTRLGQKYRDSTSEFRYSSPHLTAGFWGLPVPL
jgi:hypothetical protein